MFVKWRTIITRILTQIGMYECPERDISRDHLWLDFKYNWKPLDYNEGNNSKYGGSRSLTRSFVKRPKCDDLP